MNQDIKTRKATFVLNENVAEKLHTAKFNERRDKSEIVNEALTNYFDSNRKELANDNRNSFTR